MAQAPEDPESPRKTSTYKEFTGMNSQDGRYGVDDNEFFFMENIMRIADGRLKSVPGPSATRKEFPNEEGEAFLLLEDGGFVLLETDGRIIL